MCGRMVDIQSAMAEIRRGKKEEEDRRRNRRAKYTVMAAITCMTYNGLMVSQSH